MALVLGAGALAAQQPGPPDQKQQQQEHRQRAGMPVRPRIAEHGRTMDSLNTRLDSLVARMNRATGSQKVAAMADVINELVAQRKAMQGHMRQMMGKREGMMDMMDDSATADTAGHADHHPPK
jgi:uncharacterized coiled-coil protein SlyX